MNASMPSSVQPAHAAQNPLIWFAFSFVFGCVPTCVAGAAVNAMAIGARVYVPCRRSSRSLNLLLRCATISSSLRGYRRLLHESCLGRLWEIVLPGLDSTV